MTNSAPKCDICSSLSTAGKGHRKSRSSCLSLLREHLPELRQEIESFGGISKPSREQLALLNHRKWALGRRLLELIGETQSIASRNALHLALSKELGCSPSQVRAFINVATAFADPLPPQLWEMLVKLSRIKDPDRRQLALLNLPRDWTSPRELGPTEQEKRDRDAERRVKLSEGKELEFAVRFSLDLGPSPRLHVALQIIQSFDEKEVSDLADPALEVGRLCESASRLKTLLHPSLSAGPDESTE